MAASNRSGRYAAWTSPGVTRSSRSSGPPPVARGEAGVADQATAAGRLGAQFRYQGRDGHAVGAGLCRGVGDPRGEFGEGGVRGEGEPQRQPVVGEDDVAGAAPVVVQEGGVRGERARLARYGVGQGAGADQGGAAGPLRIREIDGENGLLCERNEPRPPEIPCRRRQFFDTRHWCPCLPLPAEPTRPSRERSPY